LLTVLAAPADAQRFALRGPTTVIRPIPQVVLPNIGTPTLGSTLPDLPPAPKIETQLAPPTADGGGDDEKCNCARDRCRINRIGNRVCEKLR